MKPLCSTAAALALLASPAFSQSATNPPPVVAADPVAQLRQTQERLRAAEADQAQLEAKLKEALAAQPAASDPRELAKAEERIKALQKDNELLRQALDEAKSGPRADPAELDRLRRALADANRKLQIQADAAVVLIAEANRKLEQQTQLNVAVALERDELQRRLAMRGTAAPPTAVTAANHPELIRQLDETRALLARAQSERNALAVEKTALEQRLADAQKKNAVASAEARKSKELERDREDLLKRLAAADRERSTRKSRNKVALLNEEMLALRAQLDVYESKAVPYTPEELALFQKPEAKLAAADTGRKSSRKSSSASAVLNSQGERQFNARQTTSAEASFTQAVEKDEKDVRALCNLATSQAAQDHFDEAEQTIEKALALAPQDPSCLGVLGYVKFNQRKFDEALAALSRATQLRPTDAGLQNLLGLTLAQKGLRGPAETAFRRALQLSPNFSDAHRNLATVYLTQQPPMKELARWHYQRALAAGHPRVPEIEKQLEDAPPAAGDGK